MSLKDIQCQDGAIAALQRAIAGEKLGHAYIFAGPDGVGRYKTAAQLARMLLCQDRREEERYEGAFYDSCGACESCRLFDGDGHPDFKHLYKELLEFTAKGKNRQPPVEFPKDVIDEFLIDTVAVRPSMGPWKIYVISEAEKVNASSQNAMLKVLEEPPEYCIIILLCTQPEKLLATTRSRCQLVRFGSLSEEFVTERLYAEGVGKKEALFWARFSEGSLGAALSWSGRSEDDDVSAYRIKCELVEKLATFGLGDAIDFAAWMAGSAKDLAGLWSGQEKNVSKKDITRRAQKGLLRMAMAAYADAMRVASGCEEGLVNADQKGLIGKLAGRLGAEAAAESVAKAGENMRWVDASVNEKLVFEEFLIRSAS